MHRRILSLALVAVLLQGGATARAADGRFHLCLDPGHGGSDSGAVRGTLVEKELNLDIARRIEAALDPTQYNVRLTRTDNATSLGNSARAVICNDFGAHAVVSIHLNASTDPSVDYAWFFYGKRSKDLAFTRTMDASYAISNAAGTAPLAHKAITNFANGTLLKSNAPSTLAEALFMSNTEEQALLAATDATSRRQRIADELVKGIRAWAAR